MIVDALVQHLGADAGVSALCQDIFPVTIPDGYGPPAITYTVESDDREMMIGYEEGSLKQALVEVRSWSARYRQAQQIADAIHDALVGHSGAFGSGSPAEQVNHIRQDGRFDLPFETDSGLYGVQQRFLIAYY